MTRLAIGTTLPIVTTVGMWCTSSIAARIGMPFALAAASADEAWLPVHQQRYIMGTMIDIVVYHAVRTEAQRAVDAAMDEIARLDRVMSHYNDDSDLSRLNREGRRGFVSVEPSLYEVIQESLAFSRRSGGRFDVTIAPLLRIWKEASAAGRRPTTDAIAAATRCVGYEKIEIAPPNRIRFKSDCLAIDLGGIGKGYAVDRAVAVLKAAGIRHALINAGGSSMAAIGAPPGRDGWPVRLGTRVAGRDVLLLRDASLSTSQQHLQPLMFAAGGFGEIVDPRNGTPTQDRTAITVVMPDRVSNGTVPSGALSNGASSSSPSSSGLSSNGASSTGASSDGASSNDASSPGSATLTGAALTGTALTGAAADALSTTLVLLPRTEAPALLAQFPDVAALWMSPAGELRAAYRETRLTLADAAGSH